MKVFDYEEQQRRRALTVKLKNSIMAVWLEVKAARYKPSFDEVIKNLIIKQKAEREGGEAAKDIKKNERKKRRENLRQ